jgi:DNA-binding transcriptional MerR regulator
MSLSITAVVRQTGIPSSTLRYYERLGLLPDAGRAANGYRQFDDRAVERLRFITRAKELGCSLEEIASLLTAFDEDCGDVQGSLRDLLEMKITDAQRRVAELVALTAQLQQARHALSGAANQGPCRPGCACLDRTDGAQLSTPKTPATEHRVLTVVPLSASDPAIACTLDHRDVVDRIADWQAVLAGVTERQAVDGGIRLTFGPQTDYAELIRLARAEWSCCSFFAFAVTIDDRGTALEVRAPADGRDLVASVFGVA